MKVRFPPLEDGDLGTDVALTDDFATVWGLASGKINLAMALYRRLTTDPGDLFYDAKYGFNIRNLVNTRMDGAKLAAARSSIVAQCMMDERVQSAAVSLAFSLAAKSLGITVSIEAATGRFDLVLRATSVTVDILTIDGIPLPEPIRPDILAEVEIPDEAPIVFPPAPPAIGHLSGHMSIGFTAHGFLKQPVGEFMSFSGYARAGGATESHANFGATTDATSSGALTRYLMPSCRVSRLIVKPLTNTRTVATTFTIYLNGVATGLTVTVPALSTSTPSSPGVAVTCNGTTDMIALVTSGAATGGITFGATVETGPTKLLKFSGKHSYVAGIGDTNYHADVAGLGGITDPSGYIPAACTVSALRVGVTTNSSAIAPVVFTVYKNGSPTSMTVTVGSTSTSPQIDNAGGHAVTFNGTTDTLDLVTSRTGGQPADDVQEFTTSGTSTGFGTWVKPLGATTTTALAIGGGGGTAGAYASIATVGSGGTGGGFGASPTSAPGGAGAGGAQLDTFDATTLPATVPVGVGGGGTAGTPSTDGGGGWASYFAASGAGFAGGGDGSPHAGSGGVETGAGGAGGTGNAGTGGAGGIGGNPAFARFATAGSPGTGYAPGGGGGGGGRYGSGSGGSGPGVGGAGGASGAGVAGGAGGSGALGNGGAGADNSGNSNPLLRAGSGGGGGGGVDTTTDIFSAGGLGGAGGRYGAGAGAPGSGSEGVTSNGTAGQPGYVVAVTTIRAGDLAFGATLELT